jgi:hypothetical protein
VNGLGPNEKPSRNSVLQVSKLVTVNVPIMVYVAIQVSHIRNFLVCSIMTGIGSVHPDRSENVDRQALRVQL